MEISIHTFCVILRNIYILYYVFLCFYCEINQYNTKMKYPVEYINIVCVTFQFLLATK